MRFPINLSSALNRIKVFKSEYRDSTLYDFSAVVRAKLYVFEYKQLDNFSLIETLPLQINPSRYQRAKKNGIAGKMQINQLFENDLNHESNNNDSINIALVFNIVDEYKLKTNNGAIPWPVDLNEATIINKLYEYATSDYRVLLKWGPLEFLSYISGITCDYDSFSPYGEPLSADVNLSLSKHINGSFASKYDNTGNESPRDLISDQVSWSKIDSDNTLNKSLVASQLTTNEIISETLPTISAKIRGEK